MPTSSTPSAQAARAAVAARLRELRLEAGLSGVELAQRCGWHKAKCSRIENARTPPSDTDIRAWCAACDAQRHADDVIASSRNAESMFVEWQRKQRTGLRRLQDSYRERYHATTRFRVYSPDIVPGFVQTPAYATALLSSITGFRQIPDDVAEAVAARTRRSQIIHDSHRLFALIIEESVLRYRIGDTATMVGQLGHLLSVMSLPTVALGIIPFTAPRPMWPLEACYIFDDRLVQVELLTTDVTPRPLRDHGLSRSLRRTAQARGLREPGARFDYLRDRLTGSVLAQLRATPLRSANSPGYVGHAVAADVFTSTALRARPLAHEGDRVNLQSIATAAPAAPSATSELTQVMTRTLPEGGIDRMTDERIEEILAVPALTAHL